VGTIAGHARLFTPAKTVAYEGLVAHVAQQAMAGRPPFDGACTITIDCVMQIPASWSKRKQHLAEIGCVHPCVKPDADNVLKAIGDGCNGVVWRDDVQIVRVTMAKRYGVTPAVHVTVCAAPIDMLSEAQQQRVAFA
jgi:Holliday junction resolvase RusA-like endonuclease